MSENTKFITKDFQEGETLFLQGECGDYIYIVIHGTVEISKTTDDKKEIIATAASGDILGEMAILSDAPRCASAVAIENTRVIMVKDRTLRMALLNNDLPILKPLTSQLVLRFKEMAQQATYYKNKVKKMEQEIKDLKENLLQYELPADN